MGEDEKIDHDLLQVRLEGLTGIVEFDGRTGERLVREGMDILNVLPKKGVIKVKDTVIPHCGQRKDHDVIIRSVRIKGAMLPIFSINLRIQSFRPAVLVIVQKAHETSTNIPRYCTVGYCTLYKYTAVRHTETSNKIYVLMETQNNGPPLFKSTLLVHENWR